MLYGDVGKIDDDSSGGVSGGNKKRAELVLVSLSDSYSELDLILVEASGTLLVHLTLSTNYLTY